MGSCMSSLSPEKTDVVSTRWRKAWERSRKARRARGRGVVRGRLFSRFRPAADPSSQPQSGCGGLNEEELHRLPGRFFLNGATEKACLFTQQGRKGTNQDAMLVWENYSSRDDTIFCGVFDGHGPYGHMVAKKVRDALPLKLCNQWEAFTNSSNCHHQNDTLRRSSNSDEATSIGVDDESFEPIDVNEGESLPELYSVLRKSLLSTFKLMDKELKLHETVDCFCSGSTAVTIIKQGQDLVIGNVGDSRAVLATRAKDNSLFAVQLTVDLKPNLPKEAARIQQCKGRVFALRDEPEVARVWLPNNDSPGLAMARAFGDFCLKDYGLISVPDISYHRITDRDEFVILATDGIWDVLSNKEVVDVIASAPTRATAARALVDCAVHAWRLKFPTSKTDDCAVVCLYLNPTSSTDQEPQISFGKISRELHERNSLTLPCKGNTDGVQLNSSVSGECQPVIPELEYPDTPGSVDAIEPLVEIKDDKLHERCQSTRQLADCMSTAEEEWSALEGVTRVNSMVNLPRFSGDKKSTN